jgi:hypothetical protein
MDTTIRRLAPLAYLVAFALVAIPLFDATMTLWPLKFGDIRWRYGAIGLFSNALMIPAIGALIAMTTAAVCDHEITRRVLGAIGVLAALVLVAVAGVFVLDALQARSMVSSRQVLAWKVASGTAVVKLGIGILTCAAMGLAGRRSTAAKKAAKEKERASTNVLVTAMGTK